MDAEPLNYWNPITDQPLPLLNVHELINLKTQSSAKKRKICDAAFDYMEGFRQRKKNNVAREPTNELLDCNVAYAADDIAEELCRTMKVSEVKEGYVAYAADDIAEELCRTMKVSEVKEGYVAYAADNHSERRVPVFHFLTGFPKKKRSVPSDDTTTSTATSNHQHTTDQVKPQINVTTSDQQHRTDQVKPQINVTGSMSDKEDEKQDHQKQQKQKKKYQKKERSKDKKTRTKGNKKTFSETAPAQEVPQTIRKTISELGGTTPVWLNEKKLTKSDTLRQQGRLFLPVSLALHEFLTPAEREKCFVLKSSSDENNQKKKKNEIIVTVVDPEGETSEMKFKFWGSLNQYVLSGANWNDLVTKFNMVPLKTKLQFWCFRKTDSNKLCLAIGMIIED